MRCMSQSLILSKVCIEKSKEQLSLQSRWILHSAPKCGMGAQRWRESQAIGWYPEWLGLLLSPLSENLLHILDGDPVGLAAAGHDAVTITGATFVFWKHRESFSFQPRAARQVLPSRQKPPRSDR